MSGVLAAMAAGASGVINSSLPVGGGVNAGSVSWGLNNDGTYTISTGQTGNWVNPPSAAAAAQYQVQVDPTAGSFTTGTTGSFLDLSSSRAWTLTDPAPPATTTVTFTVTIREKATGVVRSIQAGLTLEAVAI